ncbi:hypothetical protein CASFOL_032776 [Castilleja foliolosa]|uniref:C2H2-type domain-containing protein n=1 Tax=Castilleja foliolosa TaxID=1961234 RepID=A0ABD3C2G7_9LAMI
MAMSGISRFFVNKMQKSINGIALVSSGFGLTKPPPNSRRLLSSALNGMKAPLTPTKYGFIGEMVPAIVGTELWKKRATIGGICSYATKGHVRGTCKPKSNVKAALDGRFTCRLCPGLTFDSPGAVKGHYELIHPELYELSIGCEFCGNFFETKEQKGSHPCVGGRGGGGGGGYGVSSVSQLRKAMAEELRRSRRSKGKDWPYRGNKKAGKKNSRKGRNN